MSDTIFGRSLQEARRVAVASLSSFPVNSTVTLIPLALPSGMGSVRIEGVYAVTSATLADADGTLLVTVTARDVSENADDVLVNAQSVESLTAHSVNALALASEGSEKEFTLDAGDSLRVAFVNNSAAIDTNGAVSVFVVYFPIPDTADRGVVKHNSNYR